VAVVESPMRSSRTFVYRDISTHRRSERSMGKLL